MTLNFISDSSEAKGGFVLQYEACKNNKTLKISKYANPNKYVGIKNVYEDAISLFI